MRRFQRRALVGAIIVSAASAADTVFAVAPINEMCPVMPEEKADPAITVEYRGKTVAFCCDKCVRKFTADPQRYAMRLSGLAEPESESTGPAELAVPERGERQGRSTPDGSAVAGPRPILARYHPVMVHFPLAGLPLALVGFLLHRVTGKPIFFAADVPPLLASAVAGIAAVITGNWAEDSERFSDAMRFYVDWHQYAGTTLMIVAIALSALRLWRWNRLTGGWQWLYGGALFLACLVSAATGYLGGSLVFGPDHLTV